MRFSATARANSNIALIKYWGKADRRLTIPTTSSLSLTLAGTWTTTTVSFDGAPSGGDGRSDVVSINGSPATGASHERVSRFLDLVRSMAGLHEAATVTSLSTVPLAAGLASSAAGFAALAGAASRAAGLNLDPRSLSRLARRGSGSACRSVFGGLVQWHAGTDDASSYAEPVTVDGRDAAGPTGLDLAMVVACVADGRKEISSTRAMDLTMRTSSLYPAWAASSAEDLEAALQAVGEGDLRALGEVAEANALGMHATMIASRPAVVYWAPRTVEVLHAVRRLRHDGLEAWATMDAGPNVKILTHRSRADEVAQALRAVADGIEVSVHTPGSGLVIEEPER